MVSPSEEVGDKAQRDELNSNNYEEDPEEEEWTLGERRPIEELLEREISTDPCTTEAAEETSKAKNLHRFNQVALHEADNQEIEDDANRSTEAIL